MRTELLALQRKLGTTTIFVTHDQEEALSIADRVAVLDRGVLQQVGTPMDLYDRPATGFIAGFVGTINLLRGTASMSDGGVVFDSPVLGRVALKSTPPLTGAADIAFRPHTLTLAAPNEAVDADSIAIEGTVAGREFLGEFVRYRIAVREATLVADQPHYGGRVEFAPGSAVRVGLDPGQIRLLPPG
jgi:iron(III) transport system ATP-binding protein